MKKAKTVFKWMKKYAWLIIIGICLIFALGLYAYYHISNYFHPSMDYAIGHKPEVKGIVTKIEKDTFVVEVESYWRKEYEYSTLRVTRETELKDCSFWGTGVGDMVILWYDGKISTGGDLPQIDKVYGLVSEEQPSVTGRITGIEDDSFVIEVRRYKKKDWGFETLRIVKEAYLTDYSFSPDTEVGDVVTVYYDGRILEDGDFPRIDKVYKIIK